MIRWAVSEQRAALREGVEGFQPGLSRMPVPLPQLPLIIGNFVIRFGACDAHPLSFSTGAGSGPPSSSPF